MRGTWYRPSSKIQWIIQGASKTQAHIGRDTGKDNLFLPGGIDSRSEVGVVPSVDFTLTLDQCGVGMHVEDLLKHGPVRPCGDETT